MAGARAGFKEKNGYIMVKLDRKAYLAHRLAWFYVLGYWPSQQIDHINGDRADNRLANLRDVSAFCNQQNVKKAQKNNVLGVLGVSKNGVNFAANIEAYGKRYYLGTFPSIDLASSAYQLAKESMHIQQAL